MRPQGKSGGHGVGWSEIPQYSFDVHETFEEVAVSIADLGMWQTRLVLGSNRVTARGRVAGAGAGVRVSLREFLFAACSTHPQGQ